MINFKGISKNWLIPNLMKETVHIHIYTWWGGRWCLAWWGWRSARGRWPHRSGRDHHLVQTPSKIYWETFFQKKILRPFPRLKKISAAQSSVIWNLNIFHIKYNTLSSSTTFLSYLMETVISYSYPTNVQSVQTWKKHSVGCTLLNK